MSVIDRIRASAGRLTLCGLGVFALGFGVQWNHGNLSTLGLFLVLLSAALAGAALCRGRWHQSRGWWAVIAALCGLTMLHYPLPLVPQSNGGVQIVFVALLTASATAGAWLPEGRRADALVGLAWLSLVGLVAASWTWGKAQIDLFTAMMGGSERLLQGHNPYGPVFTYVIGTTPLKIAQGRFPYGPIGTFSPNAAFVQAVYTMNPGNSYVFSLWWKTNKPASGTIFAGAGPIGSAFSPTILNVVPQM